MVRNSIGAGRGSRGFTLIELLVVVFVIAILVALVMPAVQSAREASRRAQCSNNMRQLGLAVLSYEASYACLPGGATSIASVQAKLLPYLDLPAVWDRFNFNVDSGYSDLDINMTVATTSIAVFLCPSDNSLELRPTELGPRAVTNYAASRGVELRNFRDNGALNKWSAAPVRLADIRDGTSTTSFLSEWVVGPGIHAGHDARGSIFALDGSLMGPARLPVFEEQCRNIAPDRSGVANNLKGVCWLFGEYINTHYNHNLPPNSKSCMPASLVQEGVYTAGSRHHSGVNSLFVDGHVSAIREGLSPAAWRAMGTRAGGEAIETNH